MVTPLPEPLDGAPSRLDDVYADQPWLYIRWDNEHKCVYSEWKAFANSAEFRAGLMKGLQFQPGAAGNAIAVFTLASNDPLTPTVAIPMSGTGV